MHILKPHTASVLDAIKTLRPSEETETEIQHKQRILFHWPSLTNLSRSRSIQFLEKNTVNYMRLYWPTSAVEVTLVERRGFLTGDKMNGLFNSASSSAVTTETHAINLTSYTNWSKYNLLFWHRPLTFRHLSNCPGVARVDSK